MKRGRKLWARLDELTRQLLYRRVRYLADYGMHGQTVALSCGISKGDVYLACKQMQVKLRDYRDGKGPNGARIVRAAPKRPKT